MLLTFAGPVELGNGPLHLSVNIGQLCVYQRVLHVQYGLTYLIVQCHRHIQVLCINVEQIEWQSQLQKNWPPQIWFPQTIKTGLPPKVKAGLGVNLGLGIA